MLNNYAEDLEEVIERAKEAGVSNMVVVGFDRPTITKAMELVDKYDHIIWMYWLASSRCH